MAIFRNEEELLVPKQSMFDIEVMLQVSLQQQARINVRLEQKDKQKNKIKSFIGTIFFLNEKFAGLYLLDGNLISIEIEKIRNVQFL